MPPGEYLLTIGSGRGRWLRRQVSVGGWSPPLALTLDAVEVRGVVRAGDEPVVGTLYFGDRQDDVRIEAETDAAGGLDLTLPRPGEWPVSLLVEGSQQVVVLEPVRVEVAEPDEPAWLEVVLPDTRLSGVVVDGGDEPVPGATVWLFTPERALRDRSEAETDEDGRFELVGVPPAEYQVHAELPDRSSRLGVAGTSDRQRVRVAAGRPAEEVRLVLHRFFDVQGRVVSAGGPVAGAAVTVHPDAGTQRLIGPIDSTVTGPTGSFQATVPERATAVTLVVVAPGHAARVMRLPVRPGEPIEVPVSPEGGRLSLLLGEWSHRRPPMLHTAGTWVPLQDLAPRRVATAEGPRWILPLLTPGDYYLCTGVRLDAACQGGSLAAGSYSVRIVTSTLPAGAAHPAALALKIEFPPGAGAVLGAGFCMAAAHGVLYSFFTLHLQRQGYSGTAIGLLWTIGVVAEIAVFAWLPSLFRRYALSQILLFSLVCAVARFLAIAWLASAPWVLVAAQVLHAATFGAFHAAAVAAIHRVFPRHAQARGQSLFSSLAYGAGGAAGALVAGWAWQSSGPELAFTLAALSGLVGSYFAYALKRAGL